MSTHCQKEDKYETPGTYHQGEDLYQGKVSITHI